MELKLTAEASIQMFEAWYGQVSAGARSVESGSVKLDSVVSQRGAVHQMDGSYVEVWYKAANPPSARAIREAAAATTNGHPRQKYSGRLIDIKRGGDGTVYFMVRAVERRDERDGMPAFRCFNPSKGQLLEMTINPSTMELV